MKWDDYHQLKCTQIFPFPEKARPEIQFRPIPETPREQVNVDISEDLAQLEGEIKQCVIDFQSERLVLLCSIKSITYWNTCKVIFRYNAAVIEAEYKSV